MMPTSLATLHCDDERQIAVLLADDDPALAEEMLYSLQEYGIAGRHASDWPTTLRLVQEHHLDIIVLDQRLGRIDTLTRLPELRRLTDVPIMLLTGNRSEADRIVGLEMGADDFLLKPISGRELVARIRAQARRGLRAAAPVRQDKGWRMAMAERRVYQPNGAVVNLTPAEFALLDCLVSTPGQAIDRDTLTRRILHRPYRPEDRSIDNLVYQLRQKLAQCGATDVIRALRNQGYVFTGFPSTATHSEQ